MDDGQPVFVRHLGLDWLRAGLTEWTLGDRPVLDVSVYDRKNWKFPTPFNRNRFLTTTINDDRVDPDDVRRRIAEWRVQNRSDRFGKTSTSRATVLDKKHSSIGRNRFSQDNRTVDFLEFEAWLPEDLGHRLTEESRTVWNSDHMRRPLDVGNNETLHHLLSHDASDVFWSEQDTRNEEAIAVETRLEERVEARLGSRTVITIAPERPECGGYMDDFFWPESPVYHARIELEQCGFVKIQDINHDYSLSASSGVHGLADETA